MNKKTHSVKSSTGKKTHSVKSPIEKMTQSFKMPTLSTLLNGLEWSNIMNIIFRVVTSIIIVIVTMFVASNCKQYIIPKKDANVKKNNMLIIYQIANIIYYIIATIGILLAILNLGVHTTTILTLVGTLGFTFGLAFQGILTSIISGLTLGFSNTFNVGDQIKIQIISSSRDYIGEVISFNLYHTTLNINGHPVSLPNSFLQTAAIQNLSRNHSLDGI